jgi:septum site-determining protein MinC
VKGAVDQEELAEDWEYSVSENPSACENDQLSSSTETEHKTPPASHLSQDPAMVFEGSVRSGQQIYSQGRSLIVLGSVNSGAEVLSDGDIHVFGALKGRALAGIRGNAQARVSTIAC